MAWNPQTGQQNGSYLNTGNAFSGMPIGTFAPISGQAAPNDAFGFAPGTLNAFSFNFAAPAFQGPIQADAFAPQGSVFDLQPAFAAPAAFGVNPAFAGGVFASGPTSLLDLAQTPPIPANAQQQTQPAAKDPFASLTISDIKTGFVAPVPALPSSPAPMTPSHSGSNLSIDLHPTPIKVSPSSELDLANPHAHVVPAQSVPQSPIESQSKPLLEAPSTTHVNPKTSTNPATPASKSSAEFLASIDISAPLKQESPIIAATVTPSTASTYTNASMVKTTIDWSKQRDLMASFLAPPSTASQPAEVVPETKNLQESDDWSGYNESGEESDWSTFSTSTTPLPGLAPSSSTSTTPAPTIAHAHTTIAPEPVIEAHKDAKPEISSPSPAPEIPLFQTPSNRAFSFDTSAFTATTFDTSAFDTSAFNLDPNAFSVATPDTVGAKIDTPIETVRLSIDKTEEKPKEEGNIDFGGFTSHSDDVDWAAFSEDKPAVAIDSNSQKQASPAKDDLFAIPSDSISTPSRRRTEPKIHDLSSFELPSMPPTPAKSELEPTTSGTDLFPGSSLLSPALLATGPQETSASTASPFEGNFSVFNSTPQPENSDLFSTTEVPAWMQSNRSEDLGVATAVPLAVAEAREEATNWQDQPTMETLKKTLIELLGTDKAAPYVWIFDNYSKNISMSCQERHELATGLIEDVKRGKVLWLSSSRVNQWHSVLTKCSEELQHAHSYLSNVMVQADMQSEEVLVSYLSHERTIQYLSALSKIYKVALRIQAAIKSNTGPSSQRQTPKTTCPYLKPSVLKALNALCSSIDAAWNNLIKQVQDMIESTNMDEQTAKNCPAPSSLRISPPVPHAPLNFNCYICYRGFDEEEGPSAWNDKQCHASCANFWTHRISSKPPSV
jgi:hypothetical protein